MTLWYIIDVSDEQSALVDESLMQDHILACIVEHGQILVD